MQEQPAFVAFFVMHLHLGFPNYYYYYYDLLLVVCCTYSKCGSFLCAELCWLFRLLGLSKRAVFVELTNC